MFATIRRTVAATLELFRPAKHRGLIVYEGPSMLTGHPIVAIITTRPSKNKKTGNMAQVWILRSDMSPMKAKWTGGDAAICGACVYRGVQKRVKVRYASGTIRRILRFGQDSACYVNVGKAPTAVYHAYKRGRAYARVTSAQATQILAGRTLRLGAYGDPAAIPIDVIRPMLAIIRRHTGYTHQWANPKFAPWREILMASADNMAQARRAEDLGWRAFVTANESDSTLQARVILCPASQEAGYKTTCEKCGLCNGKQTPTDKRAHIFIPAHGAGKRFVNLVVT